MTGIPDEYVENAARALYLADYETGREQSFDQAGHEQRGHYRDTARYILEAVGLPALLERVEAAEGEGCDCTELCSMGPTCPGGTLAGLDGSGCWRTGVTE